MSDARSLSIRELKTLLINYFVEDRNKNTAIKRIFDTETKSNIINAHGIEEKIDNYFVGVMARSIKNGDSTVELFSSRRVRYMIDILIIGIVEEDAYKEMDENEKKFTKVMMREMITNIVESVNMIRDKDKSLYDNCLLWIDTVLILAEEKNIYPADVLKIEDISDEITRKIKTEEEFITSFNVIKEKELSYEAIKNTILTPILLAVKNNMGRLMGLEGLEDISEEDLKEIMISIEEDIKPKVEELLANAQPKLEEYIKNEVNRIYHKKE